jgi:hypothetical protein
VEHDGIALDLGDDPFGIALGGPPFLGSEGEDVDGNPDCLFDLRPPRINPGASLLLDDEHVEIRATVERIPGYRTEHSDNRIGWCVEQVARFRDEVCRDCVEFTQALVEEAVAIRCVFKVASALFLVDDSEVSELLEELSGLNVGNAGAPRPLAYRVCLVGADDCLEYLSSGSGDNISNRVPVVNTHGTGVVVILTIW